MEKEESDLIPTTKYIRNFHIFYDEVLPEPVEEVLAETSPDDFIIIEAADVLNEIEFQDRVNFFVFLVKKIIEAQKESYSLKKASNQGIGLQLLLQILIHHDPELVNFALKNIIDNQAKSRQPKQEKPVIERARVTNA